MAHECRKCGKSGAPLLWCSRCQGTCYCGAECQRKDWARHKSICALLVNAAGGGDVQPAQTAQPAADAPPPPTLRETAASSVAASSAAEPLQPPAAPAIAGAPAPVVRAPPLLTFTRVDPACCVCGDALEEEPSSQKGGPSAAEAMECVWVRYRSCCGARWCADCDDDFNDDDDFADDCADCGAAPAANRKADLKRLEQRCESATPISSRSADAQYVLAAALLDDDAPPEAVATALHLLQEASGLGSAVALHALATFAWDSESRSLIVDRDAAHLQLFDAADAVQGVLTLLEKAAQRGHARALYDLTEAHAQLASTGAPGATAEAERLGGLCRNAGFDAPPAAPPTPPAAPPTPPADAE
ncbi:hypothetical protein M885DRAFT_36727 [Pelagophyceae sp. CCMP2097]|nr:hypothetical protein M885DRAFT_36727 [Pelagophyceae sp. CCMP2097]